MVQPPKGWPIEHDVSRPGFSKPCALADGRVVSEELAQGKMNFRCRIESSWTLPAKPLAFVSLVIVFAVITFFARELPWMWLLLSVFPLLCWVLDDECLAHQRAFAALVDSAAKDQSLTRLPNN